MCSEMSRVRSSKGEGGGTDAAPGDNALKDTEEDVSKKRTVMGPRRAEAVFSAVGNSLVGLPRILRVTLAPTVVQCTIGFCRGASRIVARPRVRPAGHIGVLLGVCTAPQVKSLCSSACRVNKNLVGGQANADTLFSERAAREISCLGYGQDAVLPKTMNHRVAQFTTIMPRRRCREDSTRATPKLQR
ncbi:hypothetical protein BD414DRAFT_491894 [Trametes punicea]|nr:hypothetical protein BD414DRAFT_491894 [Trametes punicea]